MPEALSGQERHELRKLLREHANAAHHDSAFEAWQISADITSFVVDLVAAKVEEERERLKRVMDLKADDLCQVRSAWIRSPLFHDPKRRFEALCWAIDHVVSVVSLRPSPSLPAGGETHG